MSTATHTPSDFTWHHAGLRRVLAVIFFYVGLVENMDEAHEMLEGGGSETAPARAFRAFADPYVLVRRTHRKIAKWLLPAESAARRLILAMAVELPRPKLPPSELKRLTKPAPPYEIIRLPRTFEAGVMVPRFVFNPPKPPPGPPQRMPRFCLFDQQKRFGRKRYPPRRAQPRVRFLDDEIRPPVPTFIPQSETDIVSGRSLLRRVAALSAALDDMPRQAQRLARWRARRAVLTSPSRVGRDAVGAQNGGGDKFRRLTRSVRRNPIRVGMPPGSPALDLPKAKHTEAHTMLRECHWLGWEAQGKWLYAPDTS